MRILIIITCLFLTPLVTYAGEIDVSEEIVKLAESGDQEAQFKLAELYRSQGGEENEKKSILLYQNSAQGGNIEAQVLLSLFYYFGVAHSNIDPDAKKAYAWASVAGRQGHENAQRMAKEYVVELSSDDLSEAKSLAQKYYSLYVEPFK